MRCRATALICFCRFGSAMLFLRLVLGRMFYNASRHSCFRFFFSIVLWYHVRALIPCWKNWKIVLCYFCLGAEPWPVDLQSSVLLLVLLSVSQQTMNPPSHIYWSLEALGLIAYVQKVTVTHNLSHHTSAVSAVLKVKPTQMAAGCLTSVRPLSDGSLQLLHWTIGWLTLSSVQDSIYVLRKAHMGSTPPLRDRSFQNAAPEFQTVLTFVWLMMALSHPFNLFKEDHLALPLSMPLSSRSLMMWCPWLCAHRQCLKLLNTSDLPRSKSFMSVTLPASLSAQSFPFTLACPRQHTHRSFSRWMSTIDTCMQSGLTDLSVLSQYWKGRSLTALHCPNFNIFPVLK